MIQTEEQRRWWFATHPEFRKSHKEGKKRRGPKEVEESKTYSPEDVDAYVDEQLKYTTGREAEFLKIVKRVAGTEGATRGPEGRSGNSEGDAQTRGGREHSGSQRIPGLWSDSDSGLLLVGYYPADTAPEFRFPTFRELARLPQDMIKSFFRWLDAFLQNNPLIINPNALEEHHGAPKEFIKYFMDAKIRMEDFIVIMRVADHRLKPGGVHTGKGRGGDWNSEWREFINDNPLEYTPKDKKRVKDKFEEMVVKYGIDKKAVLLPPWFKKE